MIRHETITRMWHMRRSGTVRGKTKYCRYDDDDGDDDENEVSTIGVRSPFAPKCPPPLTPSEFGIGA